MRDVAGDAPWALLHCFNCPRSLADRWEQDTTMEWALRLHCPQCDARWWVCKECSNLQKHLQSKAQKTRHNRSKHTEFAVPPVIAQAPIAPDATPVTTINPSTRVVPKDHFSREASQRYFEADRQNMGPNLLIAEAAFNNVGCAKKLNQDDVDMFMSVAHFVSTVSPAERTLCHRFGAVNEIHTATVHGWQ